MNRRYLTLMITAVVLIALYAAGGVFFANFLTLRVVVNLFGDNAFTGIAAVGMTFVIISGGIDLSVASVIAFTTIFIAQSVHDGMHPLAAMAAVLVLGLIFGGVQGWFISFFNLPPFLVTLAGMFFARGVGFIVNDISLAIKHPFYSETVRGLAIPLSDKVAFPLVASLFLFAAFFGVFMAVFSRVFARRGAGGPESGRDPLALPVVCSLAASLALTFFLPDLLAPVLPERGKVQIPFTAQCLVFFVVAGAFLGGFTRFGRYVYAIGSNEASARLMGVPVDRIKVCIYALSGFCATAAGCVVTFYMQSGNSSSFVGLEMDAIASAVIGGTLLTGGVGGVPGTLMGVLILGLIQTLITFQGNLNNWWAKIFIGTLLFLFISIQQLLNRRLQSK